MIYSMNYHKIEENTEKVLPQHVLDLYLKKYENYPCITRTRNITIDGLNTLFEKNKKIWYDRFNLIDLVIELEGVIEYGKLMIYYKRNKDENIYKLYILNEGSEDQTFTLLINGLKKYYTFN